MVVRADRPANPFLFGTGASAAKLGRCGRRLTVRRGVERRGLGRAGGGALWGSGVTGGGGYADDTNDAREYGSSDEECRFHCCSVCED